MILRSPLGPCDVIECVLCRGAGHEPRNEQLCSGCNGYGRVVFSPPKTARPLRLDEAATLLSDPRSSDRTLRAGEVD